MTEEEFEYCEQAERQKHDEKVKELEKEVEEYNLTYENGVFKCKDKAGKRFESVDGKTWKEIVPTELKEVQERISELEEENAELKKAVDFQMSSNMARYFEIKKLEKENAEAKKLLKQFLEAKNSEDTYKAEWQAEQFLKELYNEM